MSYPIPAVEDVYPEDDFKPVSKEFSEQELRMHEENMIVMEHFIRGQKMINDALGLWKPPYTSQPKSTASQK